MTPRTFYDSIIREHLPRFAQATGIPVSLPAERMLLAIALQESNLTHRYQVSSRRGRAGPARGYWQFERGGGVIGVLTHPATANHAAHWCDECYVDANPHAVWRALEGHDKLAVGIARLLLWTSPKPLPQTQSEGWEQYAKELWRPGKPHPKVWSANWKIADNTVR